MIRGVEALGEPTRGVLALGAEPGDGGGPGVGLRPGSLDVGLAGTILVVGSRVDAEALTRARAMGVRGVVVAGLAGKERRDFLASEARQRAALHRLPPFAVLVLDGAMRRPIAESRSPPSSRRWPGARSRSSSIRRRSSSTSRASSSPTPPPDLVRVRAGEQAGARAAGPAWPGSAGSPAARSSRPAGSRSTAAGRSPIPLADLERFA